MGIMGRDNNPRKESYDVAVIGAGVVGCCIARELARFDLDIVVLEAGLDIACGATRANSGIVHVGYDPKPGSAKAQYNAAGAALYPQWQRELGFAYYKNGALVVAYSEEEVAVLHELLQRAHANGVQNISLISREELFALEPHVSPDAVAALSVPDSGICDPYGITFGAAENAADNGVEFLFDHRVSAIERQPEGFEVVAAGGRIRARAVVNAAGIYADELNNMVSTHTITIQPRRGEYHLFENTLHVFSRTMFQVPNDDGKGVLATPVVFGNLILGPNSVPQTSKEDLSTTAEGLADVLQKARKTWPEATTEQVISTYAGLRATNANGDDFIVGEAPDVPRFFNAACIDSPGLASAPAIAVDVAGKVARSLDAAPNPNFNPVRHPAPLLFMMDEDAVSALIAQNSAYGHEICHCCHVSEGELVDALHRSLPVLSLDALKWRTGATMGPCQGGRCTARILAVMVRELGIDAADIDKRLQGSKIVLRSPAASDDAREASDAEPLAAANDAINRFIAAGQDEPACFERSRASYEIPGSRPAGVCSARCALELLEMSGCAPGREAFVYGMGDTALECACALADAGVHVQAVADREDAPIGSDALLHECAARGIELMHGCEVVHIAGATRLESITVCHQGVTQQIPCDLLVVSKEWSTGEVAGQVHAEAFR